MDTDRDLAQTCPKRSQTPATCPGDTYLLAALSMAVASGGAFEWGRDWKSQDLCRSNKCTSAVWNRIVCLRTTKSHHRFLTDSDFGEQCRTCGEFITDLGRQRPHILDACEDTSTFTFKTGSCAECTPEFRGKLKLRRPRVRQLPRCHARAPSSIFYFCVVRPGSAETPLVQMQARGRQSP